MSALKIRRAENADIPGLHRLLLQVNKGHSDIRPDLFREGGIKYTDDELKEIIADDKKPIFVAESDGDVCGYAFCVHKQKQGSTSLTDIKTLYIDDLCVDAAARGGHIGTRLYEYVIEYAKVCGCYNVTLNVGMTPRLNSTKKWDLRSRKQEWKRFYRKAPRGRLENICRRGNKKSKIYCNIRIYMLY